MKKCYLVLLGLALSCYGVAQSLSPSVISSQGDVSKGNSISLEWTLGEMAIQTIRSPGGLLTEGFHQPMLEVQVQPERNIDLDLAEGFDISVAPNPVKSTLFLNVASESEETVHFQLFDLTGKLLNQVEALAPFESFEMNMDNYHSGMYLLRFKNEEGQLIQTFKITKVE